MNIFMVLDRGRTVHRAVRERGKPSLRTKTIVWLSIMPKTDDLLQICAYYMQFQGLAFFQDLYRQSSAEGLLA
jgi:hypothetical protein